MKTRTTPLTAMSPFRIKIFCTFTFLAATIFLASTLAQAQMCKAKPALNATQGQSFKNLYDGQLGVQSTSPEANKLFAPDVLKLYKAGNPSTKFADYEAKMNHRSAVAKAATNLMPEPLGAAPSNDTCAGAVVIPPGGPFPVLTSAVDITDATLTGDPPTPSCAFNGGPVFRGVWYTFTPSNSNRYRFVTCSDQGCSTTVDDTTLAIYTSTGGCPGTFSEIATTGTQDGCDDDSCTSELFQSVLTTTLNSGTQYYIVIFNLDSTLTAGNSTLQLKVEDLGAVVPPANDTCAGAITIPNSGFPVLTTPVDVTDATTTGDPPTPSCQSSVSRSIWYTFTPTTSQDYTIASCQSEAPASTLPDSVIAVYTSAAGCAGAFTQRAGGCDDDTCTTLGLQSRLTTRLEAGTQYYVVVWKFGTTAPTSGNDTVQLSVSQTERNEGPGIYYSDSTVFLRDSTTPGTADFTFTYGNSAITGYQAISGDWNGDGVDTIGLYNPATAEVFLAGTNASGATGTIQFTFGTAGQGYIPLAGDWDNDGRDTIGLYDPATGNFFLKNTNSSGPADITFQYGAGGQGYLPVAGDYNNDGTDTVGLFAPSTRTFFLRNSNTAGDADLVFVYGPMPGEVRPVIGDWNGDGTDTVGIVSVAGPSNGAWFLRNSNSSGNADITPFTFGVGGGQPIAGDWTF
jgi:hypothetical protein